MHSTRHIGEILTFFKDVFLKWCIHIFICDVSIFTAFEFQVKWDSNIQGVSQLEDITAGSDFLGLCDQKSSYKHVSDFGRLRSYGHF
jgi:hypothetical protein